MNKRLHLVSLCLGLLVVSAGCQKLNFWKQDSVSKSVTNSSTTGFNAPRTAPSQQQRVAFMTEMAGMYEQQGQTDQAVQAYQGILSEQESPIVLHRLGVLSVKQGNLDAAISYFQRALDVGGANAELLCDLGYGLYVAQRYEEAESRLLQAVEQQPELRRGHANLGMLFARTGRYDDALLAFSHAGLTEAEARNNLAFAMLVDQRLDEASHQYDLAMRADPNLATPRHGRAALEAARNQLARNHSPRPNPNNPISTWR